MSLRKLKESNGRGIETTVHWTPSHRIRNGGESSLNVYVPTSHAFVGDVTATPVTKPPASGGLGTTVHALPSQCSVRVTEPLLPTAHTFRGELPDTAVRTACDTSGVGTIDHPVPSQCSARER